MSAAGLMGSAPRVAWVRAGRVGISGGNAVVVGLGRVYASVLEGAIRRGFADAQQNCESVVGFTNAESSGDSAARNRQVWAI